MESFIFLLFSPLSGQRYSTARLSNESTTGKEGIGKGTHPSIRRYIFLLLLIIALFPHQIELKESTPYTDPKTGATGIYTFKIYHLGHYVPKWLRKVIPASALILEERVSYFLSIEVELLPVYLRK